MSPTQRAKNAAFLCCHFARNLAYYNAGRKFLPLDREGFWLTTMGNCIDVCILEWCKLFGNRNGKYHWRKVLHAPDDFIASVLSATHLSRVQFDLLYKRVKNYRDEFVAHLEGNETTIVPDMSVPYILVCAYYRQLCEDFPTFKTTEALPRDLGNYLLRQTEEANDVYRLYGAPR